MKILTPTQNSAEVTNFEQIRIDAEAMHIILKTYVSPTGKGPEQHYALHHSQFSSVPFDFFVINPYLLGAKDNQIVLAINPKIKVLEESRIIRVREGCMSFPFRHGIQVKRYDVIEVTYQVPDERGKKLLTKTDRVEGLMAQIFQHERDHAIGKHIYLGTNSH